MPSKANAQARGLVNADDAGSPRWKSCPATSSAGAAGTTEHAAERPNRAPVTVLRADHLGEAARVAHEVSEATLLRVESVVHEGEVPRRELSHDLRIFGRGVFEEGHQKQGSRVVVEAIAILAGWNREGGVLQDAGAVGHRFQVLQVDPGQLGRTHGQGLDLHHHAESSSVVRRARSKDSP